MLRTAVILLIVSQLLLRSLAAAHEHSHDLLRLHTPALPSGFHHLHLHADDHHHHHQPGGNDQHPATGQHDANDSDDCTPHHDCLVVIEQSSLTNACTGTQSVRVITQASLFTIFAYDTTFPAAVESETEPGFDSSISGPRRLPDLPLVLRI